MLLKEQTLAEWVDSAGFRFARLDLSGIDNSPVLKAHGPEMTAQEICLFHREIPDGRRYFALLHERIAQGVKDRRPCPVVRFADGEYAFYRHDLHCNGLYQQAESVAAIRSAMPAHIEALRFLAGSGVLAPLIFPGNTREPRRGLLRFLKRFRTDSSALRFLDFLSAHGVSLTPENYIPFYVVYAYLTSEDFARLAHRKNVCLVVSAGNPDSCRHWFSRFSSAPELSFADLPESYVATRWPSIRETVLQKIPAGTDLCLVGAGAGALPACNDISGALRIPAIDAGHVLNLMNGREMKSGGPRLYTLWSKYA
jgi:hypothetical protein